MTRTEEIYEELKLADRMTPGRTPWQTLLRRAEEMAGDEEQAAREAGAVAKHNIATMVELTTNQIELLLDELDTAIGVYADLEPELCEIRDQLKRAADRAHAEMGPR